MKITRKLRLPLAALLTSTALLATTPAVMPAHSADDAQATVWDLTDLYASPATWEAERQQVLADMKELDAYRGRLGESAATLLEAADKISALQKSALRLLVYATLSADEDLRVSETQERRTLAQSLFAELSQATSFIAPELLEVGPEKVESFIAAEPGLEKHAFNLRDTLRQKDYTLSKEAEKVLANAGDVLSGPGQIYGLMTNASIPWPSITLSNGEEVKLLNQSAYTKYRAVQNRDDRKAVFDAFWGTWKQYEAMLGATLATHVKGHVFGAKSRGYENALAAAVSGSNIPTDVYRTLVDTANDNLPSMHRYLKLRQRLLGLEDLNYYDIYPEVTALDRTFTVDDAKEMTLVSLQPFGEKYLNHLKAGFADDWMHVLPQPGKRPGAYMFGSAYDVHPYVLLNFNGGFEDVSTFSHEWGHAVHTLLSRENQPFENFSYTTFTAELASTTNEVLLQEYMLAKDLPDAERLYYIDRALEGIRGTFFRQTMFAEFELKIHEMQEAGEALSGSKMTAVYLDLLKKYHGHDEGVMTIDEAYAIEWAYIPHFYRNFYVYQYATSISGGTAFAERMLAGDKTATEDYIKVLEAGGSEYPYELLKASKIDLASKTPYEILIGRMNRLMDEAEAILDRMGK
ncbi:MULTISPECIES: oligoendopeptidase F [Kordiimonas]|jgi:oligoendopeptidase F|uniref:oligoendopeptidase F n=1 Tax=Kordiimonas TaxID=288021 RepID=UPI00257E5161|nr:oligoendopeptidase F [Kordiimonas sp. UBA4487]